MADRSPAPDAVPDDAAPHADDERELEVLEDEAEGETDDKTDDEPAPSRSLTNRWWWQGAVAAGTGVIVIVWQWSAIGAGEAIVANWVMVALGAAAVVAGAVMAWHDRPTGPSEDDEDA